MKSSCHKNRGLVGRQTQRLKLTEDKNYLVKAAMAKLTYDEQLSSHLNYLQLNGLDVELTSLVITEVADGGKGDRRTKWTRFKAYGHDYSYKVEVSLLTSDLCSIHTLCRGCEGIVSHATQGWPSSGEQAYRKLASIEDIERGQVEAANRAYGFWQKCSIAGTSDYIKRKGVGGYGIRYHSSLEHGTSVIVPMLDEEGYQWGCQSINPDGSKRFARGCRTSGLYHLLRPSGTPTSSTAGVIGVAEGYSTAATCLELTDIPVACAFSSGNVTSVVKSMLHCPGSTLIVVFADNDRHLSTNPGLSHAREAQQLAPSRIIIATPNFGSLPTAKDASDWNDLVRILGAEEAKKQIQEQISI